MSLKLIGLLLIGLASTHAFAMGGAPMNAGLRGLQLPGVGLPPNLQPDPPRFDPVVIPPPPAPAPAPVVPPPPSESELAANSLRGFYTSFLANTAFNQDLVSQFILNATKVLFRHSEHVAISKSYFQSETRITFKILFGSIVYIVNPGDAEVVAYLTHEGGLTPQEFAEMDAIRTSTSSPATPVGVVISHTTIEPSADSVRSVVARFISHQ